MKNLPTNAIIDIEAEIKHEKKSEAMIREHKRRSKNKPKFKASVEGCPNHTMFECSSKERAEMKVKEYKEMHSKYWVR